MTSSLIPIIDIFAGPGGLGEGFSAFKSGNQHKFKIKLSIEKESSEHQTLELRAFFRQFTKAPSEYYKYLRKEITKEELFSQYPKEYTAAQNEAWKIELAEKNRSLVKTRINEALGNQTNWVLIGGPPCQAYSLVGRSRMRKVNPWKYAKDHRHKLYKEYLQILADHQPPVFVMENVKGLLSSQRTITKKENTFDLILADLKNPSKAVYGNNPSLAYKLFSVSHESPENPEDIKPESFVVRSEEYGIPQSRHRIIILGIRSDIYKANPELLKLSKKQVTIQTAIGDLPKLRSGISKGEDTKENWQNTIKTIIDAKWLNELNDKSLKKAIIKATSKIGVKLERGGSFVNKEPSPKIYSEWYLDSALLGVCNHETRAHIKQDLHRYFFASVYASIKKCSPKLEDFPKELLPLHKNVKKKSIIFNDRFKVQIKGKPSTTVVSHISKDGHYYIHYDPSQCRSLTVREAARLQTFPDNYFFEGNRTQQYHQVGNAVPPMLAYKIAEIVYKVLENLK
ncbi:MAG TPA: DNA cytosine methyltransferase [Anaerolineae bacterium]|nr:DNA cytosine methyltransferase [Anaerolineae bacterium]